MSDEKSNLVNNNKENGSKSDVKKAWNRMISEGYKYKVINDSVSSASEDSAQGGNDLLLIYRYIEVYIQSD